MYDFIRVIVTKHALERLFERFPKHKKFDARTVTNIIENVIKNGVILNKKDIKISTSNYTLCCTIDNDRLIIKTIMNTKEMSERYRKAIAYGKRSEWRIVFIENVKQVEKWCKQIENMKNVCKICGISKDQVPVERCKIYGFYVCIYCCPLIGGYSDKCRGCTFDIVHANTKPFKDSYLYIF